jgi:hypothetical protein
MMGSSGNWQRTNVYGGGALVATYDAGGLHFHLADPLGTRRLQTSAAGVPELDCQSLPFGDQQYCFTDPNAPAVQVPAEATLRVYRNHCPAAVHPRCGWPPYGVSTPGWWRPVSRAASGIFTISTLLISRLGDLGTRLFAGFLQKPNDRLDA